MSDRPRDLATTQDDRIVVTENPPEAAAPPALSAGTLPGGTLRDTAERDVPATREVPRALVDRAKTEIDLRDTHSVLFFGSKAQEQLSDVSERMLHRVRTKDLGPAGDLLNKMVSRLGEFEVPDPRNARKRGLIGRLLGKKSELDQFLGRYEDIKTQIETITDDLERKKTELLTDVVHLDKLYDANLDYFRTLEVYIAAGRERLAELDNEMIPELERAVSQQDDVVKAQELRDLRAVRDDLERRIHDLLLTRQVTMQSLPSIRLVQENDKALVAKITSTIANTVPLWKQQLAQAITIHRSGEAARAVRAATDLTNDLLKANAENLQTANREVRQEMERGVFDAETVKEANDRLIQTIEESLQIADEGRRKRAAAENELERCEDELRKVLSSASAPTSRRVSGRSTGQRLS